MIDFLLHDFMGRALLAGIGMASVSALMGCFLIWRRMAFFGDAMGHAAVLGVALGTVLNLNVYIFITLVCLLAAGILGIIQQRNKISTDTWLGSISYASLAMGLILLSKNTTAQIDPESILFGDILAVNHQDLLWIYSISIGIWVFVAIIWQKLLLVTLDEELAYTSGASVMQMRLGIVFCVAIVTAVGLKAAGALLLPALMILPAATVSRHAKSPEVMITAATLVSILSVVVGILASFYFDTPSGPTIVITAFSFFVLSFLSKR